MRFITAQWFRLVLASCFCAVVAGRRKAEHADVPVEVAGIPAKHERSEGGIAKRKLGVAGFEVEGPESPQAERPGELRNADANIDIHGDHARHDGDGIGARQDLPRVT